MQPRVVVDGARVRPVALYAHRVEAVLGDQPLRDGRAGPVELRGAVAVFFHTRLCYLFIYLRSGLNRE